MNHWNSGNGSMQALRSAGVRPRIDFCTRFQQDDCIAIRILIRHLEDSGDIAMASITIRNLDEEVKTRLRVRAAKHHRSMEAEVRLILRDAVGRKGSARNLARKIRSRIVPLGGVDLELPPRGPGPEPPSFG